MPGDVHTVLRPRPRPPRPGCVRLALTLGIASAALGLAVMVIPRVLLDDSELRTLQAELSTPDQPLTLAETTETLTTLWNWVFAATIVVALVWSAIVAATYRGSRWARIVLTIMGGIWILLGIPSLGGQMYGGTLTAVAVGLNIILVAATLVVLYLPDARNYFAPTRYDIQHTQ